VPLIVVLSAMGVMGFSVISPALPDLATALAVDSSAIGWVQGAVSLPGAALSLLLGWLADRIGRKPVLIAALLLFGTAGTAAAFADSFAQLITLRMIQGAGGGALLGLPVVIIGDLFEGEDRTRIMGLNLASITTASASSPLIGGVLAEADPFRPFFVYSVALLLIPVAMRLPTDVTRRPEPPLRHLRSALAQMRARGTFVDFLGAIPAAATSVLAFGGIVFVGTPLHLDAAFGLGPSMRGIVISVASGVAAIVSVNFGTLMARLGRPAVFTTSIGAAAIGLAVMALPLGVWAMPVGLAIVGYSLGTMFPLLGLVVADSVEDRFRGVAVGTYMTGLRATQTIAPVVASSLFATFGGNAMYAIGAALAATATVTWRRIRSRARHALHVP
jgi:MFS family permease